MEIFLMRHGAYQTKEIDPDQGLSKEGKEQAWKMGSLFKRMDISFDMILTSYKKRALETASIVGVETDYREPIVQTEKCSPLTIPEDMRDMILEYEKCERILIVGHLPSLSDVSSLFLSENADMEIHFQPASCLMIDIERKANRTVKKALLGMISPDMID